MENAQTEANEKAINEIFEAMRCEKAALTAKKEEPRKPNGFVTLPDGQYIGRVYIKPNTVGTPDSPNYGMKKYQFEYTVTAGEFTGKMAYFHYVIVPHHLAAPPPKSDQLKSARWAAAVRLCLEDADKHLKKCGVETTDFDPARLVQSIAANNRRKPIVSFSMVSGTPHTNYLISSNVEDRENSLFTGGGLPDGNDAPLV